MQIEITGETERCIQAALASGKFASAEEFIAATLKSDTGDKSHGLPRMPTHVDIDTLAAAQGVGPIKNFRDLKATFWNDDDSVDTFVNEIRALRDQDAPRDL